jgi:hypothetical protein
MIQFRCWYCNRAYAKPEKLIGEKLTCGCKRILKVPSKSGGRCRVKTLLDWVIKITVYGGGGALLGLGLGLLILSQFGRAAIFVEAWLLVAGLTVLGFLVGALGGERGINWIGGLIRGQERR